MASIEDLSGAFVSPGLVDVTGETVARRGAVRAAAAGAPGRLVRRGDRRRERHALRACRPGLISNETTRWDHFLKRIRAGVVNWNRPTTGAAGTMPFGGLGSSGNHRPQRLLRRGLLRLSSRQFRGERCHQYPGRHQGPARMTSKAVEANCDGLVGPTHSYVGLSPGNIASQTNAGEISNPRAAVLEGLTKMRRAGRLGRAAVRAAAARAARPGAAAVDRLFGGSDAQVLETSLEGCARPGGGVVLGLADVGRQRRHGDPQRRCTADGRVHFTPANLLTNLHRSLEGGTDGSAVAAAAVPGRDPVRRARPAAGSAALRGRGRGQPCSTVRRSRRGRGQPVRLGPRGLGTLGRAAIRPARPARPSKRSSAAMARRAASSPARASRRSTAGRFTTTWSASARANACCSTSAPSRIGRRWKSGRPPRRRRLVRTGLRRDQRGRLADGRPGEELSLQLPAPGPARRGSPGAAGAPARRATIPALTPPPRPWPVPMARSVGWSMSTCARACATAAARPACDCGWC
jgi:hypothetical protein